MPHEIIMPALGMAQDTGVIVAWLKKPGDAVKSDDVLMEVETDKTTMEVEAGHEGFLAEIRAEAGVPIPVGDVVAVISESADGIAAAPATAEKPEPPTEDAAKAKTEDAPTAALAAKAEKAPPEKRQAENQAATAGRILASPKARLLASQRGIDLRQLEAEGHVVEDLHVGI